MSENIPTGKKLKQLKKESSGIVILALTSAAYSILLAIIASFDLAGMAFAGSFETTHTPTVAYLSISQLILTLATTFILYVTKSVRIAITAASLYSAASLIVWVFGLGATSVGGVTIPATLLQIICVFLYVIFIKMSKR